MTDVIALNLQVRNAFTLIVFQLVSLVKTVTVTERPLE